MEPWNCLSDGKGTCFDNEMDLSTDSFGRSRNSIFGTDQKTSNSFGNDGLMSDFIDIGLPDIDSCKAAGDSSVKIASSCLIASNLSFGLKECYPKLSKSLVGSKDGEFSISEDRSVVSSLNPSSGAKKARSISSYSQMPFCQVHGCNIDLTSSKDYHKRHRVCEAHSKTAKVIVNGIEQRFCQQCSRFHLIVEFDDGKRSCRRRLAGHNERRRKPQFNFLSSKQHKLLHSYKGSKLFEGSLTRRSYFGFPEVYAGGFPIEDGYEQSNNCKLIKFEDKSVCSPGPAVSFAKGNSQQKPSLSHRALSLLSVQSQDFPDQVTGAPYVRFSQAGHAHLNMNQKFEKDYKGSSGSIPVRTGLSDPLMADLRRSRVSNFQTDDFVEDSTFLNPGLCFPPGNAPTVDLFQLSSHLQRVEQQKSSVQVKHEIAEPCYFLGT